MKKFKKIIAGMNLPNVYKTVGQPQKTVVITDQKSILIYFKKRFLGRLDTFKVSISDGVVTDVKISTEKRIKINETYWRD